MSAPRARKRIYRTPINSDQVGFALPADRQHPDVLLPHYDITASARTGSQTTHIDTARQVVSPIGIGHSERYVAEERRPPSVIAISSGSTGRIALLSCRYRMGWPAADR